MRETNSGRKSQRCLMCDARFRQQGTLSDILWSEDLLCSRCRRQWERVEKSVRLDGIRVESVWLYNDAFSSALLQFKECGDEALKDIFLWPVCRELRHRCRGRTLIGMPSTEEKRLLRGFDHVEEMFGQLNLPYLSPFIKDVDDDQKQKGRSQRYMMSRMIRLKEGIELPRKIVLVDDVMTTGSTLKGALSCLDRSKHDIRILTAAYTPAKKGRKMGL